MTRTRQWAILTVLVIAVVAVAGWLMLIRPTHSHAADVRTQVVSQQQANQQLQTEIASLRSEQKGLPEQQQALQRFATRVPTDAAEPTMVRQLVTAAAAAGIELVSITPGTASPLTPTTPTTSGAAPAGPQLMQLPVSLGVDGSFANLESYFQQLETLPRALTVTGWSMCPVTSNSTSSGSTGSSTSTAGSSAGASCSAPTPPANKVASSDNLGGTLSAVVYYVLPAATATSPTTTSGAGAAATTGTTATPSPTPTNSVATTSSS